MGSAADTPRSPRLARPRGASGLAVPPQLGSPQAPWAPASPADKLGRRVAGSFAVPRRGVPASASFETLHRLCSRYVLRPMIERVKAIGGCVRRSRASWVGRDTVSSAASARSRYQLVERPNVYRGSECSSKPRGDTLEASTVTVSAHREFEGPGSASQEKLVPKEDADRRNTECPDSRDDADPSRG